MTDATDAPKPQGDPVPETPTEKTEKTFTQDDFDRAMAKERKKWEARYEEADRKAREEKDLERLEGEAKLQRQWEIRERELKQAKEEAERKLAISSVESKLATMGYSEIKDIAPALIGEDESATDANVTAFGKMVQTLVAAEVSKSLAAGPPADPSAGNRPDPNATLKQEMRQAAGLPTTTR